MKKILIVIALAISLLKITYAQTMDNRVSVNYLHNDVTSDTYNLSVNVWHYVAVTKDNSGNGTFYIDGVSVFSGSWVSNPYSWSNLYIGANYYTSWAYFFKGWIDELRLSNSVRSLSEIQNYYNSSSPFSQDANTLGLWHFDETSGTTFNNTIGGSGTLTGGATFVSGNFGNAVQFDGTSGHGNCGINPPESNWTIEFWFKFDNTNTTGGVMVEPYGMYTTNIALIKVPCTPPSASITAGDSTTFCIGGNVLLTAVTNAGAGATYQWYLNSNVIGGATNSTYSATASGSYSFSVINSNGCSATSTPVTVSLNACQTPTNISVSNITGTKATINWTGNNCAAKYRVRYRVQGTTTWVTKIVTAPITTKTLTLLQPLSTYEYQVRTDCNSAGTSYSAYSTIQTFTTICDCLKPTNIAVSNVTQTSATISWLGNWCAVKYRLQYRVQGTTAWTTKIITAPTLFYNIIGFTNNTIYEYHLRTDCNSTGTVNSGWTTTATITTPLRLEDTEIGSSTFYVSPNPCSTCFVNGTMNEQDLMVTDIVGRKINVQFTKSENGFYINLPEHGNGIFLIRNSKTGEVVKFVKE